MRKLIRQTPWAQVGMSILLLLLLPALCFGQELRSKQLWEVGSTYKGDMDTCAVILDTTALDSAIFYADMGVWFDGTLPTVVMEFDSTGIGTLVWADSVTVTMYPRVPVIDSKQDAGKGGLETLWNEGITLTLGDATSCVDWAPTAEQTYFASKATSWTNCNYQGVTVVVLCGGTVDHAIIIKRLRLVYRVNR